MGATSEFLARVPRRADGRRSWPPELNAQVVGWRPPGVTFSYAPGRSGQHADDIWEGFSGTLQVDGNAGYNRLLKRPAQDVASAYCWAHARRKLHDVTQPSTAPIAQEGLAQIQAL